MKFRRKIREEIEAVRFVGMTMGPSGEVIGPSFASAPPAWISHMASTPAMEVNSFWPDGGRLLIRNSVGIIACERGSYIARSSRGDIMVIQPNTMSQHYEEIIK